jgi:hypothetical protein
MKEVCAIIGVVGGIGVTADIGVEFAESAKELLAATSYEYVVLGLRAVSMKFN